MYKKITSILLTILLLILPCYAFATNTEDSGNINILSTVENSDELIYVDQSGNIVNPVKEFKIETNNNDRPLCFDLYTSSTTPPSSFDARDYGLVTSVKNQGYSGSCSVFTLLSAAESDSLAQNLLKQNDADFSEAHYAWFLGRSLPEDSTDPNYGEGYNAESPYTTGYHAFSVISAASRWSGFANEKDFPFTPFDLSLMGNYNEAERYNRDSGIILSGAELFSNSNDVKNWITEHGSVSIAYYFDYNLLYDNGTSHSYYSSIDNSINHMSTIVGWDDNYSVDNFSDSDVPPHNGAWLVKNSWGTSFGDNGYMWVSYYDASLSNYVGYKVSSAEDCYNNYTYNGAEWASIATNTGTASIANVFKTQGHEILTDISTYVLQFDATLNISVYINLPTNYSSPVSGTKAASWSVSLDNYGYHTIPIPREIELAPNTYFSVVVEFENEGKTSYIPLERSNSSGITYTSTAKQSYLYMPQYSSAWRASSYYGVNNCFVQALTKCNHQSEENIVQEATCTTSGLTEYICLQCNKTLDSKTINATGHDMTDWKSLGYNSQTGKTTYERNCTKCEFLENYTTTPKQVITLHEIMAFFMKMIRSWFSN